MFKFDGIIFDVDGVLIDDSKSCRFSILKTVNFCLKKDGFKIGISKKDVEKIKKIPGFNNDWVASFELIKIFTKNKTGFKYQDVRDIWQNFYLGSKDFKKIEKKDPPFENNNPLRLKEKSLVKTNLLKLITKSGIKIGIATSRPREQANFSLKRLKLKEFFTDEYLVGQEDARREKPFPDPLLEAKRRMKLKKPIFVGDTINDCLASEKANMPCIYVGKETLGDYRITDVNKILEVLI